MDGRVGGWVYIYPRGGIWICESMNIFGSDYDGVCVLGMRERIEPNNEKRAAQV